MVSRFTLIRVLLNSFFIQASWSFEKMQGLGFTAAMTPAIKDIYKGDRDRISEALKRHMVFYNAHPYMAAPILGAVIRMEEDVKEGKRSADDIISFKDHLMGPYGAIGDTFFWGSVRPFASVAGVLSALIFGLWGALVFLTIYNIFHLWMRWFGLYQGYRFGEGIVRHIKSFELPQWALRVRLIATGLLGILVGAAIIRLLEAGFIGKGLEAIYQIFFSAIPVVMAIIVLSSLLRKGVSASLLIYLLFLPAFVFMAIAIR